MAGDKSLGLAAVAELAGVSTGTVSNVLNNPSKVRETTRRRVLDAIEAAQFVPNRAAAALRQGNSRMLGLLLPSIIDPFYAEIADGAAEAADRLGYGIVLCVSDDDPVRELRQIEMLARQRVSGALVVPIYANVDRLAIMRLVGSRVLVVDHTGPSEESCSIAVDDRAGGKLAVEHLLNTCGPRIAIVNGDMSIAQCVYRREGALLALSAQGGELAEYEGSDMTIAAGREIGLSIANGLPDGIFCINDQLALGVILGLTERGVSVPGDVSVVGYGDLTFANETLVTLTSVKEPRFNMAALAIETLVDEIENTNGHDHRAVILQPALVVRESAPIRRLNEPVLPPVTNHFDES